jgi:serine/threonine-protein kinase
MRSGSETTQPAENVAKSQPAPPGMVYVPGGELLMGDDGGEEQERPAHKIAVNPFFIDRNEVTCEEYAQFIAATGHRAPSKWTGGHYPDGFANRPVTGVDWDDASAYAAWAGKRLPTEQEWEFAARGSDGRRYPWGSEWKPDAANAHTSNAGGMINVGTYPAGASPFGANDLAGNAWEWTATDWVPYPGGRLPEDDPALPKPLKVIRGGCYDSSQSFATATFRIGWPARGHSVYDNTGFRCAKDIPASGVSQTSSSPANFTDNTMAGVIKDNSVYEATINITRGNRLQTIKAKGGCGC